LWAGPPPAFGRYADPTTVAEVSTQTPTSVPVPPPTRTVDQVDDYHGETVADPYRWLEDTNSAETRAWIAEQNRVTQQYLSQFPEREAIRARLGEMFDYPRWDVPFERGGRWFQTRNSGLQNQSPLYLMRSPDDEGTVLLDPNEMSPDGTVSLSSLSVTDDGSLVAYAASAAGSDWMTWHVRDVECGEDLPDMVEWAKFASAAWLPDGSGFFYGAAARPEPGAEYTESTRSQRVQFHRLGTSQREDFVVFEAPEEPDWLPYAEVTEDGRYCLITISRGTNPESSILVLELGQGGQGGGGGEGGEGAAPVSGRADRAAFESGGGAGRWLVEGHFAKARVITNVGSTFYVLTDQDADRQRIVAIELGRPEVANWREVVAEREALLLGARNCGGHLVCHFLEDACSRLKVFGLDGAFVREIPVPPFSALRADDEAAPVEGRAGSDLCHFGLWSFTDAGSIWSHDVATAETSRLRRSQAPLDESAVVTEQVFVEADDGVKVPMFLVRRRDVVADGEVPVLLYGYGGFDIPLTPEFNWARAVFVERGGMMAIANLRGGGEYGKPWHDAGRLATKQRVFDDFCECARWLASSGWSRPGRIAINGGSNGGLLVGACLTQHPELFGAAVPEVGVLDMLRYHLFTIGWAWTSDFGNPDNPEEYPWLRAYSPLHNVQEGLSYPPTLVMTGDHDDRVVPPHSFKFAAALQAAQARRGPTAALTANGSSEHEPGESEPVAPVLIRIETSAGHGHGKPVSKIIAERADMLTFVEAAVGRASGSG
jgi:prolyl oligopeptidase